jgi:hypothetical protein
MAQSSPMDINGVSTPEAAEINQSVLPGKRKRDSEDEGAIIADPPQEENDNDTKPSPVPTIADVRDQAELVKTCFEALKRCVLIYGRAQTAAFPAPLLHRQNKSTHVDRNLTCICTIASMSSRLF